MSGFKLAEMKVPTIHILILLLSVSDTQQGPWDACPVLCLGDDPCVNSRCTYPGAFCVTNYCGGCGPLWLDAYGGMRRLTTEQCNSTEAPSTSPAPITKCSDTLLNCAAYGRSACLPPFTIWGKRNCPLFCGFCTGNSCICYGENMLFTSAAPLDKCSDKLPNCADYARSVRLVCSPLYASWARINCPLFCGYCSVDTTPTTARAPSTDTTKSTT